MTRGAPLVEFVISGISLGSTISLLAVGLVLVYRTTGVLNLAHWAVGMTSVAAYVALTAAGVHGPLAAAAGVPVATVVGVAAYRGIFRGIPRGDHLVVIVVAVATAQLIAALVALLLRLEAVSLMQPWLPAGTVPFLGASLRASELVTTGLALSLGGGLVLWLGRSRAGRALRAVAQNPEAAHLAGIDVARWSSVAWGLGGALSGAALLVILPHAAGPQGSPLTAAHASPLGTLLIPAFGAALVGGLVHLPMTLLGGLAFGLLHELLVLAPPPWSGLRPTLAALLIVLLLLLRTDRLFSTSRELEALER